LDKYNSTEYRAISRNENCLFAIHELCLQSIQSLRSSEVRNGILCYPNLLIPFYPLFFAVGSTTETCEATEFTVKPVLGAIIMKTTTGPKFVADLAWSCLNTICNSIIPLDNLCICFASFGDTRSPLVFHTITILLSKCIERLTLPSSNTSATLLSTCIPVLYSGLSCKKADGKTAARSALAHVQKIFFQIEDIFPETRRGSRVESPESKASPEEDDEQVIVEGVSVEYGSFEMYLDARKCAEVRREIQKLVAGSNSAPCSNPGVKSSPIRAKLSTNRADLEVGRK
jgi:hypothetical protein